MIYFLKLKQKYRYMTGNFDSMQACFKAKRAKYCLSIYTEWIIAKKSNEIYFYNI
jgi:hypothetical protein